MKKIREISKAKKVETENCCAEIGPIFEKCKTAVVHQILRIHVQIRCMYLSFWMI